MLDNNSQIEAEGAAFLDRLTDASAISVKRELAKFTVRTAVEPGSVLFVASGTTTYLVAEELLKSVAGSCIWTNSAPLLGLYLQLKNDNQLAADVELHVVKGQVNPTTGIISSSSLGKLPTRQLLYSPHGLSNRGIVGRRDIVDIMNLIKKHKEVIMPVDLRKIGREAPQVIKHLGHLKREIKDGRRKYRLIVPARSGQPGSALAEGGAHLLDELRADGVEVTELR